MDIHQCAWDAKSKSHDHLSKGNHWVIKLPELLNLLSLQETMGEEEKHFWLG